MKVPFDKPWPNLYDPGKKRKNAEFMLGGHFDKSKGLFYWTTVIGNDATQ